MSCFAAVLSIMHDCDAVPTAPHCAEHAYMLVLFFLLDSRSSNVLIDNFAGEVKDKQANTCFLNIYILHWSGMLKV